MTKQKFRSNYNYDQNTKDPEVFDKKAMVSKVVPGLSYTVRELYQRHAAGSLPDVAKVAIWDQHPSFDSWTDEIGNMDLVEAEELARSLEERGREIQELKDKVKKSEYENITKKSKEMENYIRELSDLPEGFTIDDLKKYAKESKKPDNQKVD